MTSPLSPIVAPLMQWYAKHRRDLPWRADRDPYHVWVSEVMLQQTRVEAVKRYYARFMKALPTVADLSAVSEEELLKLWEGLGYYSRARNLRRAAVMILTEFGGRFPESSAELRKLPGVGEYTAGAVASICFGEKIPAVDGNVLRVTARLLGSRENVLLPETKRAFTPLLGEILPDGDPGGFNQALMELGESVCIPGGTPDCAHCPLRECCVAFRDGLTSQIPVRIKQLRRRRENRTVLVLLTPDDRIALRKRSDKGLLSGMYELPNVEGFLSKKEIAALLRERSLTIAEISLLGDAKHAFTHLDWFMKGWLVRIPRGNNDFLWASPNELATKYPLPTAFRPFLPPLEFNKK